jgi:hypothetical protein
LRRCTYIVNNQRLLHVQYLLGYTVSTSTTPIFECTEASGPGVIIGHDQGAFLCTGGYIGAVRNGHIAKDYWPIGPSLSVMRLQFAHNAKPPAPQWSFALVVSMWYGFGRGREERTSSSTSTFRWRTGQRIGFRGGGVYLSGV